MIDYDQLVADYRRHRRIHPEVLRLLIETSQVKHGSKILEVGCGTGNYINAICKAAKASGWGLDSSEKMFHEAQTLSPTIRFQKGKADALPFEDHFFDFVFSVDVIHHLDDVVPYFAEIFRVLKRGGIICTVTDSEEIIQNRRPLAFYFPETISVDLQRYPSILVLRKRMEEAGFQKFQQQIAEFRYELTDIQPYHDKAFSCLHLISSEAYQTGLTRMANDLSQGPIPANSRYALLFGQSPKPTVFV
ncbi:MAG: class I SAM-dependent methyltransferase [Promethearchaeota archaeon]